MHTATALFIITLLALSVGDAVASPDSSSTSTASGLQTTAAYFVNPCNCSISLNQVWSSYSTMANLTSASQVVVVANVTSISTRGVNTTVESSSSPKGLIPVTEYSITVMTVVAGVSGVNPGETLSVAQIGGIADGTNMSVDGYPTLSTGQQYVLFLTSPASLPCCLAGLYSGLGSITTGGPQGLFYIQNGSVYSLNNTYPQADSWLQVTSDAVPLSQFITDVQDGLTPVAPTSQPAGPGFGLVILAVVFVVFMGVLVYIVWGWRREANKYNYV